MHAHFATSPVDPGVPTPVVVVGGVPPFDFDAPVPPNPPGTTVSPVTGEVFVPLGTPEGLPVTVTVTDSSSPVPQTAIATGSTGPGPTGRA
jgi:hypothetical protein